MAENANAEDATTSQRSRKPAGRVPAAQAQPLPLRGRIPAIAPSHARALRALFRTPHSWLLRDNGLLHLMPGRAHPSTDTFELDAEGTRIGLRLQSTAAVLADGLHWSDFNGRSRILAWSLAHEQQLMRLSEALGVALTPLLDDNSGDGPDAVDGDLWLDFLIDDEPPEGDPDAARRAPAVHGSLRLPAAWIEALLVRAEPPFEDDAPPPLGRWRELPATVSLQFQVPPLSLDDWDALAPGAVFVVGRSGRRPAFQARACGRAWPLALVTGGWRVEGPSQIIPGIQENPMNDIPAPAGEGEAQDRSAEGAPATATGPDAASRKLPVEVAFEVGRMQLPLGKLAELQPGYVFPVPAQLEGANVTIRANGEAVGQGELVSVGDTLGVRLLSWK